MLVELILKLGNLLISIIFGILGVLPDTPDKIIEIVDKIFELLLQGVSLVTLFVDIDVVKILIPILLAIINFDNIYHLIMYVIKKIPFIDIK